jgi:hypothetical protein
MFRVAGATCQRDAKRADDGARNGKGCAERRTWGSNGAGVTPWPRYGDDGVLMEFGAAVGPRENVQAARFRFLASFRSDGVFPARWRALA